ncbi:MAG: phage/plasmid primase, P4 family [Clostridium fessum]
MRKCTLKVLGSYGCTARPETIAQKNSTNSSQPSEDIARLAGVRFVNISEPGKGLVLNAAQVKSMTGNDTINARFLHENSFDFQPLFKLYINTNYLPAVNDMTIFTSGRVIIIPFERHFDESEQDKTLKKEFAKPEVQSAILNWLLEGYALLKKDGLLLPQSVKDATSQYQHDSDKMILFMEDCMEARKL